MAADPQPRPPHRQRKPPRDLTRRDLDLPSGRYPEVRGDFAYRDGIPRRQHWLAGHTEGGGLFLQSYYETLLRSDEKGNLISLARRVVQSGGRSEVDHLHPQEGRQIQRRQRPHRRSSQVESRSVHDAARRRTPGWPSRRGTPASLPPGHPPLGAPAGAPPASAPAGGPPASLPPGLPPVLRPLAPEGSRWLIRIPFGSTS